MKRIICLLISILIILILIPNIPILADSTNLDETNENELEETVHNYGNDNRNDLLIYVMAFVVFIGGLAIVIAIGFLGLSITVICDAKIRKKKESKKNTDYSYVGTRKK